MKTRRLALRGSWIGCAVTILTVAGPSRIEAQELGWSQFRGPGGNGIARGASLPDTWSSTENVVWARDLSGRGWSSPIVWEDRLFVASATSDGSAKPPSTGIFGMELYNDALQQGLTADEATARVSARDVETTTLDSLPVCRMLYCLDVADGSVVWEREVHSGLPPGGRHRKNTYATETPVTDGDRVYVYFGNIGLFAYSMDGELLWSHDFEPLPVYYDFGPGASPAFDGQYVYVLNDNEQRSFLTAIDKTTGAEAWTVDRTPDIPFAASGWSTPLVWNNTLRTEIVTVGLGQAISYSTTGQAIPIPTPVAVDDVVYVGTGAQGGPNRPMFAVRAGASGIITLNGGESSNDDIVWSQQTATAYVPSPLVYDGRVYSVLDNGVLQVFDALSGARLYRVRVGGGGHTFAASPWAYDDKVFFLSEEGATVVVAAGPEYREMGTNALNEMSLATPAVSGDSLFIRTATKLYRIRQTTGTNGR